MRISDLSSYVCSSDLVRSISDNRVSNMIEYVTRSELRNFADKVNVSEQAILRESAASRSLSGTTFLSHSSKDDDLVVGAIRVLEGHGAREIGRASCRERVCQYV